MRIWLHLLIASIEATVFLTVVYFEPTYGARGKLWGEAFFEGKPTSWWRTELELWDVEITPRTRIPSLKGLDVFVPGLDSGEGYQYEYSRPRTSWEKMQDRYWPRSREEAFHARLLEMLRVFSGPSIVKGEEAAVPVLRELLNDRSPKIRRFARIGLKMDPESEN